MPNELHSAASDKNGFEEVKRLVNKDPSIINEKHTIHGTTAIEFAAQSGSLETLQYLLQQGATITADDKTENLLYWASDNKDPEVIHYIANPDNKIIEQFEDGTTYFHAALVTGKMDEVKQQIEQNNSLLFSKNNKSQFSSHWALLSKHEELIGYVFDKFGLRLAAITNSKSQRLLFDSILRCVKVSVFSDILVDGVFEKMENLLAYLPEEEKSNYKNKLERLKLGRPQGCENESLVGTFFNSSVLLKNNEDKEQGEDQTLHYT